MIVYKVVAYILLLVLIGVAFLEWKTNSDTRIFSEAMYECDYNFNEILSEKGYLSAYLLGFYWKEVGSTNKENDDLHAMVEILFALQELSDSKCDKAVISKLDDIKRLDYDFSGHRGENNNSLVLISIALQNVVILDWLLNNDYYTDMKLNDLTSDYHGMGLVELAESFDLKLSDDKSSYISKVIREAHAKKYEKI